MIKHIKKHAHYGAWAGAFIATAGSLFLSEVVNLPPCALCWYQRILMYPLVVIIGIGIIDKDERMPRYALPLSIMGVLVALYHNLLYYGIIPESLAPCVSGFSCTTKQLELLGFITIPLMSLAAFVVITILLLVHRKYNRSDKQA